MLYILQLNIKWDRSGVFASVPSTWIRKLITNTYIESTNNFILSTLCELVVRMVIFKMCSHHV